MYNTQKPNLAPHFENITIEDVEEIYLSYTGEPKVYFWPILVTKRT